MGNENLKRVVDKKTGIVLSSLNSLIFAAFIFVCIFFFFSFFTISCSKQEIVTIKGYELVTGIDLNEKVENGFYPGIFNKDKDKINNEDTPDYKKSSKKTNNKKDKNSYNEETNNESELQSETKEDKSKIEPNYWAIIAAAAAILGAILSISLRSRKKFGTSIFLGIIGIGSLFMLHYTLADIIKEKQGEFFNVIEVQIRYGYWGAIAGFGVAIIIGFICNIIAKISLSNAEST